jgi:hypothetical protein
MMEAFFIFTVVSTIRTNDRRTPTHHKVDKKTHHGHGNPWSPSSPGIEIGSRKPWYGRKVSMRKRVVQQLGFLYYF